jgi:hypothetical protein
MPKYLMLYNSNTSASDRMAQATSEQMQASMGEWIKWKEGAEKSTKFEFGMPLQVAAKVAGDQVGSGETKVSGYSFIEGDKDTVLAQVKSHPHLKEAGNYIELLEVMPMPGL